MLDKTQEQIMSTWNHEAKPLVTIKCLAYNHQDYIGDAMDGFLSQITDFPFEIIVHDDASTDQTASIIRQYEEKYPAIVKPIYQTENQFSKHDHSISRIIHQHTQGKYVALCDGDDYWIDTKKLQKQIDCMREHPDCGLCYTNFNILQENQNEMRQNLFTEEPDSYPVSFTLEAWIQGAGYVAPMTWVYKTELYDTFERLDSLDFTFEFFAHFLAVSNVICLKNETTAVYRIGHESAVHTSNHAKYYKRVKSLRDVKMQMVEKYQMPDRMKEDILTAYYNQAYRLIGLNQDAQEIQVARKYCRRLSQRLYLFLIQFAPIRQMTGKLYARWHR